MDKYNTAKDHIAEAIALLRTARDLLVRAECPKAAARVRLALSSALGAQRAADHRKYRDARHARVVYRNPDDMGDPEDTVSVEEFIAANVDDPELCDAVRALKVGETVRYGGGAQPVVEIGRVS